MNVRNYEKNSGVLFLTMFFLLVIVIMTIFSFYYKINDYYLIRGIVFKEDLIEIVLSNEEKKILYKNSFLYIDGKKYNYDIEKVINNALVKNEESYDIFYIKCDLKAEKEGDVIDLVFMTNRIKLYEIFKLIWEEK